MAFVSLFIAVFFDAYVNTSTITALAPRQRRDQCHRSSTCEAAHQILPDDLLVDVRREIQWRSRLAFCPSTLRSDTTRKPLPIPSFRGHDGATSPGPTHRSRRESTSARGI